MKWLRRRQDKEQDARIEQAKEAAEAAQREIDLSRRRAESVREHVNRPRWKAAEHNQFGQMIRATLINGNGGHT